MLTHFFIDAKQLKPIIPITHIRLLVENDNVYHLLFSLFLMSSVYRAVFNNSL